MSIKARVDMPPKFHKNLSHILLPSWGCHVWTAHKRAECSFIGTTFPQHGNSKRNHLLSKALEHCWRASLTTLITLLHFAYQTRLGRDNPRYHSSPIKQCRDVTGHLGQSRNNDFCLMIVNVQLPAAPLFCLLPSQPPWQLVLLPCSTSYTMLLSLVSQAENLMPPLSAQTCWLYERSWINFITLYEIY